MERRKVPYSECEKCPLINQEFCGTENNILNKDISNGIDILILGEAPSHEEIKKKVPLVGRAGEVFRKSFESSGLNKFVYIISNVVLCSNIVDGKTFNPPDNAFLCCKGSWQFLINKYKPKLVFALGSSVSRILGILDNRNSISDIRGKIIEKDGVCYLSTFHPSYILRNGGDLSSGKGKIFNNDFFMAVDFLKKKITSVFLINDLNSDNINDNDIDIDVKKGTTKIENEKGLLYYVLPEKYYSEEYVLLDCQNIGKNRFLYIFKNIKNNKKEYFIDFNDEYYFYVNDRLDFGNSPYIESVKNVTHKIIKTSEIQDLKNGEYKVGIYESDVKETIKRIIDYRIKRKDEEDIDIKKMYFDIEVYNDNESAFPDPAKAEKKISSISYKIDNDKINIIVNTDCYYESGKEWLSVEEELKEIFKENINIVYVNGEIELIKRFIRDLKKYQPDVITGWNVIEFDFLYLINRMGILGLKIEDLSVVNSCYYYYDGYNKKYVISIGGTFILDMMSLHKDFSDVAEESYSLNYISEKYLGIQKVSVEGSIDDLYNKDKRKFIEYAARDIELLCKLDAIFSYIDLYWETCKISCCSWLNSLNTMGVIDSLCISYMKKKGMVCRSVDKRQAKDETISKKILGAYVLHPISGKHNYVIDLDFSSLYPSIISTFNIGPNTIVGKISESVANRILYKKDYDENEYIDVMMNIIYDNRVVKRITIGEFLKKVKERGFIISPYGTIFKSQKECMSYLTVLLLDLLSLRKKYKKQMLEEEEKGDDNKRRKYFIIQSTYKIFSNSIYGVLCNKYFRFFNLDMAQTITIVGRTLVKFSGYYINEYLDGKAIDNKEDVSGKFLDVYDNIDNMERIGRKRENELRYIIYQDTDSIFCDMGRYWEEKVCS